MATVQEALEAAIRAQTGGQLDVAAELYRRILAVCPDHADALHLSGLVARHRGDGGGAVRRMTHALACNPGFAEPYHNLANALGDQGRAAAAAGSFRRALTLKPGLAEAHAGLARCLRGLGRAEEALAVWRAAIAGLPDHVETRNGYANTLQEMKRIEPAASAYRSALALDPQYHAGYANLAAALRGDGQAGGAAVLQRRALLLRPDFAAAMSGLGLALAELDRIEEARRQHVRAIALQPDFAGAVSNLASAELADNRVEGAIGGFRRAIRIDPTLPDPHRNLGIALLLAGRLGEAWPEYDWRLKCADTKTPAAMPRPRWDGGALDGRSILLHAEQGLGDVLQFARYVPMVAARGGRVILCAPRPLERLLGTLAGVERFVAAGDPVSGFDIHTPLLSLPLAFGTQPETIPAAVPYLRPDSELVAIWGRRLAQVEGFRVGVVWAGSAEHGNDRNRSLPLAALAPLAAVEGARLVAIQKGPPAAAAESAAPFPILSLSSEIADFADTAAIIANLDLVVTVDTSVAHLAGALGRPVWVLLAHAPDWRWMLYRSDSPWYPTMRLFRQERPGAWAPVVERAARDLRCLMGKRDMPILVPVSWGELLDKITILEIKGERIGDPAKLANVQRERDALAAVVAEAGPQPDGASALIEGLRAVNAALWDIEDEIRDCERDKDFTGRFVELARAVYHQNDRRARLKRELNDLLGSDLVEEKSYQAY